MRNGERSFRRLALGKVLSGVAAVILLGALSGSGPIHGQIAPDGYITSNNWLALGPFSNPAGVACSGSNDPLLANFIAPSFIHCQYPVEGDTIDYDPALAASDSYNGPTDPGSGKPMWRVFNDGTDDNDLDMEIDAGSVGSPDDLICTFVATYFQYLGAASLDAEFCVGSDDGVQVWLDDGLVHNNGVACRPRGPCDDRVPVTITPGTHRIIMGVWENGGGFGGLLSIQVGGVAVTDADPSFLYLGTDNGGFSKPCVQLPVRLATSPGDPTTCPPQGGGPITVKVSQPGGTATEVVKVQERVSGSFSTGQVTANNGGTVTAIPQDPVSALGPFGDHRELLVNPNCSGAPGEWYANYNDNGTPGPSLDDTYVLGNIGEDIWQNGDTFTYVYQKVKGDFVFTAHVANRIFVPGSRWGKHGVMARQDLTTRSRYSFVHDHGEAPQDPTRWASRPTHGGNDNYESTPSCTTVGGVTTCTPDHYDWLRIERTGNKFNGYSSPDNSPGSYIQQGTLDWGETAPATILLGLAVTSHTTNCADTPAEITFDQVDLQLGAGASIQPASLDPGIGVDISWNVQRSVLQAAGVGYSVNINSGRATFGGNVAGTPTFGSSSFSLIAPPKEFGPFKNPQFDHGHNIGTRCGGTAITQTSPGVLQIDGAGNDIWATGDQFMYAYKQVTGDFSARVTITNRVYSVGSRWGKHGIMARQDCGINSRYSFIHDNGEDPQDSSRYASRPNHGGAGNFELVGPLPAGSHFDTLRLDRCGSQFISFVRDDQGLTDPANQGLWVEVGRSDWGGTAPPSVQLGLAVTSHDACNVTSITFEDWQLLSHCDPAVLNLTCTENQPNLDLSWQNPPEANPAQPISVRLNGAEVQSLPGTATKTSLALSSFPTDRVSSIAVVNSSEVAGKCTFPSYLNDQGFIKTWLLLGPYKRSGGPAPPEVTMRLDYLTDGAGIDESTVSDPASSHPVAGDTVNTKYKPAGPAASTALLATPANPALNPGGVPTWDAHVDADDTIDFTREWYKSDLNNLMVYALCYLDVDQDMAVSAGLGSDDAIQVQLDGTEVFIDSVARPPGAPNEVQDTVPEFALTKGTHKLLIKVFEGVGDNAFRFRFQDATGNPVISGYKVRLGGGGTTVGPVFHRGDADGNGTLQLTDAVRILNFLFLGTGKIDCKDAADADNNGTVQLTDAVRILNVLFLGTGTIPDPGAPGPSFGNRPCGPDPADGAHIGCDSYNQCGG